MKCPICSKEMECITPAHVKTHNMTMAEFREKYPDTKEYSGKTIKTQYSSSSKPWLVK